MKNFLFSLATLLCFCCFNVVMAQDCVDTNVDADGVILVDSYGDGCDAYANFPSWCNGYDTDTFISGAMCCACGGGETAAAPACDGTEVSYTLGGGSYDGEMSFTLNGVTYGAGTGTICLADGCFDVTLTDSYGDGWNGGTLTLGDEVFGMASGASGSGIFGVNTDCNVYGCMDSFATNYSADANTDDGTCEYDCSTYAGDNAMSKHTFDT